MYACCQQVPVKNFLSKLRVVVVLGFLPVMKDANAAATATTTTTSIYRDNKEECITIRGFIFLDSYVALKRAV